MHQSFFYPCTFVLRPQGPWRCQEASSGKWPAPKRSAAVKRGSVAKQKDHFPVDSYANSNKCVDLGRPSNAHRIVAPATSETEIVCPYREGGDALDLHFSQGQDQQETQRIQGRALRRLAQGLSLASGTVAPDRHSSVCRGFRWNCVQQSPWRFRPCQGITPARYFLAQKNKKQKLHHSSARK